MIKYCTGGNLHYTVVLLYYMLINCYKTFIWHLFVFFPLVLLNSNVNSSVKRSSEFQKASRISDGTSDLQLSSIFASG